MGRALLQRLTHHQVQAAAAQFDGAHAHAQVARLGHGLPAFGDAHTHRHLRHAGELGALKIGGEPLMARIPGIAKLLKANPALKNKQYTPEDIFNLVREDVAATLVAGGQNGTVLPINIKSQLYQQYSKEIADLYTAKTQSLFTVIQPHLLGVPIDPNAKYDYTYKVPGFIFDNKVKADIKRQDHVMRVLLKEDTNDLK